MSGQDCSDSNQWIKLKEPIDRPALSIGDVGGGIYHDYNVLYVIFEGLDKGSVVEIEYEVRETQENLYADYFGATFNIGDYDPAVLSEYVLIFPKERDVFHKVVPNGSGLQDKVKSWDEKDARVYQWRYTDLPGVRREPMMPAGTEILPYLKISTFSSWDKMAKWYWDLAKNMLKADSAVKTIVTELVPDRSVSPREKLQKIYEYVANDVRYLGLEFGIQGYKPRPSGQVCRTQYGDCKDKAALAVTLLSEVDVPAELTLLRTKDKGEIDYELPSLGLFNHAILHLKTENGESKWLDGTAGYTSIDELPPGDQGANSLIMSENGEWEFKRIPVDPASRNAVLYDTALTLDKTGKAEGTRKSVFTGAFNPGFRRAYENDAKIPQMLENQFGQTFPGTKVSDIIHSDFKDFEEEEWISYSAMIPQFARTEGEMLRFSGCLFPSQLSDVYTSLTKREHDIVMLYRWQKKRELTVTIPPGYRVDSMPESVNLDSPFGKFDMAYKAEENTIVYTEDLVLDALRVPVEQYQAFREFCAEVDRNQKREVVLVPR